MISEDSTYEKNCFVAQTTAVWREKHIADVKYSVDLVVPKGEWYAGRVTIEFTVKDKPLQDLWLDFRGVKIGQFTVNKADAFEAASAANIFRDHRVYIPTSLLKVGESNSLSLSVLNKYRKDGVGLHSFVDGKDGQQYLYTQFEADFCHFLFPCFDQPDLKATWTLRAQIPQDWEMISNEASFQDEAGAADLGKSLADTISLFKEQSSLQIEGAKSYLFPESFRTSTYLYAVCAGPFGYHERKTEGLPPMRIWARQSLVADVNHQLMFDVTESGMWFYKDFFGKAYPFRKYDQVFVPEHNYGAMENVGCVTYNENYIYKGETPTLAKLLRFSITNLHELAHMWFGNLVTMKWWNDLWLNESFATFMSFLAMSRSPKIAHFHDTCWVTFLQYKFWGISSDNLSSTHPICTEIATTGEAEALFDGISYGKGSAVLNQLFNILGFEVMSKGLHKYFEKYQWGNTQLPDFVGALEEAWEQSGDKSMGENFSLSDWCDTWLKSSGVNILEPVVEQEADGRLKSLYIRQTNGVRGKNVLRKQKLSVGLYEAGSGEGDEPIIIKDVVIGDIEELTQVDISALPQDFILGAVNVNQDEHAYAKVRFDQRSVEWFTDNLHTVKSAMTRASIWRYFWMLVMDKQITSLQYMDFVQKQLPHETVEQIIAVGLMNLRGLIAYYIPQELVPAKQSIMFETLISLLQKEGVSKDPIVDQLFGFMSTQDQIQTALGWVETGKITVGDASLYDLGEKHKKLILKCLFKSLHFSKEIKLDLLDMVLGEDKSDQADLCRHTCMAALPEAENKAKVWAELTDPNNEDSVYVRSAKMQGFNSWGQIDLVRPYFDKFYDVLPMIHEKMTYKKFDGFFHSLLPRMEVSDAHIVRLLSLKLETSDTEQMFANTLQDGIELLIRSKEIRANCQ